MKRKFISNKNKILKNQIIDLGKKIEKNFFFQIVKQNINAWIDEIEKFSKNKNNKIRRMKKNKLI